MLVRSIPAVFALLLMAACSGDEQARDGQNPADGLRQAVSSGLLEPIRLAGSEAVAYALADRMAFHKVPGISIAVMQAGEIVFAAGYGEVEAGSGKPVTTDTLFQAASISKPVAAYGALRLVEQGVIDLDRNINELLTRWQLPDNEFSVTEKVTTRRLMTHTAGLTTWGFPGYAYGSELPSLVAVLDGAEPANTDAVRIYATPGSQWQYSGGGYTIMQMMMEDVTGKAFPDLLNELVLAPSGMTNSAYDHPISEERRVYASAAHDGNGELVPGSHHIYPELAAAGLWTTPSDLLRFAARVADGYNGVDGALLSQEMSENLLTGGMNNWGLGLVVGEGEGADKSFSHGGSNNGFRAILFAYVDGRGAAIMTNGENGSALFTEVLHAIAAQLDWPDYRQDVRETIELDSDQLAEYAGQYAIVENPDVVIPIGIDDAGLWVRLPGQNRKALHADEADKFFTIEGNNFVFERDHIGEIARVVFNGRITADRLQD